MGCLEELNRPAPTSPGTGSGKPDSVHIFHTVLPELQLQPRDEAKVAQSLRAACAALLAKHNGGIRSAGVGQWEVRFRVADSSGAWRLVASCPTGECLESFRVLGFRVQGLNSVACNPAGECCKLSVFSQ